MLQRRHLLLTLQGNAPLHVEMLQALRAHFASSLDRTYLLVLVVLIMLLPGRLCFAAGLESVRVFGGESIFFLHHLDLEVFVDSLRLTDDFVDTTAVALLCLRVVLSVHLVEPILVLVLFIFLPVAHILYLVVAIDFLEYGGFLQRVRMVLVRAYRLFKIRFRDDADGVGHLQFGLDFLDQLPATLAL